MKGFVKMQTQETALEIRAVDENLAREIFKNSMQRDFPREELRPLRSMIRLYKKGVYSGLAAYIGGELVAYAFFGGQQGAPCILLDYYAVEPSVRGQGVGGRFLTAIREELGDTGLLIEAENPASTDDEAEKTVRSARVRFYEHVGAVNLNLRWLLFGVEYTVLHLPPVGGQPFTGEEAKRELRKIYEGIVPKHLPGFPRFL